MGANNPIELGTRYLTFLTMNVKNFYHAELKKQLMGTVTQFVYAAICGSIARVVIAKHTPKVDGGAYTLHHHHLLLSATSSVVLIHTLLNSSNNSSADNIKSRLRISDDNIHNNTPKIITKKGVGICLSIDKYLDKT